jgi:hypothetical protein
VARAEVFVDEFTRILGGKRDLVKNGLQFDRVYEEVIYPNYGIGLDEETDLGFDDAGRKIFGYFEPGENKAYIDLSLRKDPRREFTRWHEVAGHGILQGAWLRKLMSRGVTTEDDLAPGTINVLERQANLFAANAAAPLWLVDAMIVRVFRPTKPFFYPGPCGYWLDANGWSRQYHILSFDDLQVFVVQELEGLACADLKHIPRKPLHLAAIAGKAEGDAALALLGHGVVQIEKLAIADQVLSIRLREFLFRVVQASLRHLGCELGSDRVPMGIDDCPVFRSVRRRHGNLLNSWLRMYR